MTERRVEVPGGRLAVHDFGEGPPVALLHAAIVDAWAWEPLTPFLLAAGYRVVAFDRRDAGDSLTADVAYSDRADTIAVLDALGIGRACLVGNSRGGSIALDTAVEFPGRVAALVTIGSSIGGLQRRLTPQEALLFDERGRLARSGDVEAMVELDLRLWVDGPGQPPDRVPAEIRDLVREMDRDIRRPDRVHGRPIPLEPPAVRQLGRLGMPLLAIAGSLDIADAVLAARDLEAQVPGARAEVIPDVGHLIGLEAPEQLARHLVAFLDPIDSWL